MSHFWRQSDGVSLDQANLIGRFVPDSQKSSFVRVWTEFWNIIFRLGNEVKCSHAFSKYFITMDASLKVIMKFKLNTMLICTNSFIFTTLEATNNFEFHVQTEVELNQQM